MKEAQKILITGMAGFIGFHLAKLLASQNYDIVGLDNLNSYYDVNLKLDRLEHLGFQKSNVGESKMIVSVSNSQLRFIKQDIDNKTYLLKLFEEEKFDYVIHLAAQAGVRYSITNPDAYITSNIIGFHNMLECCRHFPVKHLIYASSSSVYGLNESMPFTTNDAVDHPVSLYACTKRSNELQAHVYSHLYSIPTTGLRFFTVYGPWGRPDMAPMLFAKNIIAGNEIKVFNEGKMLRDFTYVGDIVEGIQSVIKLPPIKNRGNRVSPGESDVSFRLLNIGCSAPVNLMDFIKILENEIGLKANSIFLPMQPGDVVATYADTVPLNSMSGFAPKTNLEEGIKKFVEWFLKYYGKK